MVAILVVPAIIGAMAIDYHMKLHEAHNMKWIDDEDLPSEIEIFFEKLKRIYQVVIKNPDVKNNDRSKIVYWKMGDYHSIKIPILSIAIGILICYCATFNAPVHQGTVNLPFQMSMSSMISMVMFYIIISVVWGPRLMEGKEPYNVKKSLIFYNTFQVILSIYTFYGFGVSGWFGRYNYLCEDINYNSLEPMDYKMAQTSFVFFLIKILDLADTIFYIATKKWSHISVLHVVHHSSMVAVMWFGQLYVPVGQMSFAGFINSSIHMVMYSYYLLSSFGPTFKKYLWWKRYITALQLIQFVVVFLHGAQSIVTGCPFNKGMMFASVYFSVMNFIFFFHFYQKSYTKRKEGSTANEISNGISNGVNGNSKSLTELLTLFKTEESSNSISDPSEEYKFY